MLFQLALVLIPVVLIGYPVLAWYHFRQRGQPWASPARIGLSVALAAFPPALALIAWRILRDPSSTAAIALYLAPQLAALVAGVCYFVAWAIAALARPGSPHARAGRAALLLALLPPAVAIGSAARRELRLRRAGDPRATAANLAALYTLPAVREDPAVLAALAANPVTPPALLEELARRPGRVLAEIAVPWHWRLLGTGPREAHSLGGALARNSRAPAAALERLAALPSPEVAIGVAANPLTPPADLVRLASARNTGVRAAAAFNPATPESALARLAADPQAPVRLAVAANPAAPPQSLAALARDPGADTRIFVATNPHTPRAVLEELVQDPDGKVRHYAAQALADKHDG